MQEFQNFDNKRVCDVSDDKKTVIIRKKGCMTRITANKDGTLNVTNVPDNKSC